MSKKVNLTVNNNPIELDYFVHEFVEKTAGGIIASLHDTGDIEELELKIDGKGMVTISLNSTDVTLKEFPMQIIKSTIEGMVFVLRGVEGPIETVEISIRS
jgi:hypothetical protein